MTTIVTDQPAVKLSPEEAAQAEVRRIAARRRRTRSRFIRSGWNLAGLGVAALMIFPVYWLISSSFKLGINFKRVEPQWFPNPFTLDSYARAFSRPNFLTSVFNSVLVVGTVALVCLIIGFIASLALARMNFKGRSALVLLVIIIQMVPLEGLIIPIFLMLNNLHLTNRLGLGLAYLAFVLPFTVWMLRGFISAVPKDLEEAALVDGCTRGQAFRKIILPLAAPGLVATTIFSVIQGWNEYLFALTILKDDKLATIPVWLDRFFTSKGTDWTALVAASTIIALPIVVLFSIIQRNVATGITSGAVKG